MGTREGEGLFRSLRVLAVELSSRLPALGHWEHPDSCAYRLVLPGELPAAHTYPTLEQPSLGQLQTQTQPQLVTVPNGFTVLIGKPGARLGEGRGQAALP